MGMIWIFCKNANVGTKSIQQLLYVALIVEQTLQSGKGGDME